MGSENETNAETTPPNEIDIEVEPPTRHKSTDDTPPLTTSSGSSSDGENSVNEGTGESVKRKRDFNRRKSHEVQKKIKTDQEGKMSPYLSPIMRSMGDEEYESFEEELEEEDDEEDDPDFKFKMAPPREESYSLKWKNYESSILGCFAQLYDSELFCDVTLIAEGSDGGVEVMKGHRVVLSSCSEYFARILQESDCKHPTIVLMDYKGSEVRKLLEFMYKGRVEVGGGLSQLRQFRRNGESLKIRGISEALKSLGLPPEEEEIFGEFGEDSDPGALNLSKLGKGIKGEVHHGPHPLPPGLEVRFAYGNGRKREEDEEERKKSEMQHQGLLPRRKQARPRRRSGDFIPTPSLDLSLNQNQNLTQQSRSGLIPNFNPSLNEENNYEDDYFLDEEEEEELLEDEEGLMLNVNGSNLKNSEPLPLMNNFNKLLTRRLLDEPHPQHQPQEKRRRGRPPKLHHNVNNNHSHQHAEGLGENEIIDYTKGSVGAQLNMMAMNDNLQQQHLAFLRNYNWAMGTREGQGHGQGQGQGSPPPKGLKSPPNPFSFGGNGNISISSSKSPKPGSPYFMGQSPSLRGDDSNASTPSPHVYSPMGTEGHGHSHGHGHGGHERKGAKEWPGLPLGPPPIFGRHRAQHSAPRGGPPRAWSNADLTEALHNVWNKKMTTSQASRIFGIPYNSLLMYVRGKYGKSLKLDLLKKGLDQALENTQAAAAAANNASNSNSNNSNTISSPTTPNAERQRSKSPNNSRPHNQSPASQSKDRSNEPSSAVSALLNSLHGHGKERNNNFGALGSLEGLLGSKGGGPHPQEIPPGAGGFNVNPFLFEGHPAGHPFPFANALQHILPPHLAHSMAAGMAAASQGQGQMFGGALESLMGRQLKREKVGGDEDK